MKVKSCRTRQSHLLPVAATWRQHQRQELFGFIASHDVKSVCALLQVIVMGWKDVNEKPPPLEQHQSIYRKNKSLAQCCHIKRAMGVWKPGCGLRVILRANTVLEVEWGERSLRGLNKTRTSISWCSRWLGDTQSQKNLTSLYALFHFLVLFPLKHIADEADRKKHEGMIFAINILFFSDTGKIIFVLMSSFFFLTKIVLFFSLFFTFWTFSPIVRKTENWHIQ